MNKESKKEPSLEIEDLLSRIESEGLTFRAMTAVYHNDADFNYQIIPGRIEFRYGVAFFIDTEGHLQESGLEEENAHPLGVDDVAPFRKDYLRHPKDYEYILCRHKDRFWLSVIRHDPSETRPERIQETALAVVREYLSVTTVRTFDEIKEMILKAEKDKEKKMDELAKKPIIATYPPRTAREFFVKYSSVNSAGNPVGK